MVDLVAPGHFSWCRYSRTYKPWQLASFEESVGSLVSRGERPTRGLSTPLIARSLGFFLGSDARPTSALPLCFTLAMEVLIVSMVCVIHKCFQDATCKDTKVISGFILPRNSNSVGCVFRCTMTVVYHTLLYLQYVATVA
jgi:hypothetical protein